MKNTKTLLALVLVLLTFKTFSQVAGVGINATGSAPHGSAILDISSTTGGLLPPRMTTAQRDVIVNPAQGLTIYNLDTDCFNTFDGLSQWRYYCPNSSCPTAGMANYQDKFSIEINERPLSTWYDAVSTCDSIGLRLCFAYEFYLACVANPPLPLQDWNDGYEWGIEAGSSYYTLFGNGSCFSSGYTGGGQQVRFRCCCGN